MLDDLFALNQPVLESIIRATAIFWAMFFIFRFALRRDPGSLSVTDILFVVIISEAIQNPMAGKAESLSDGLVLVGTLVFWNMATDALAFYWPPSRRFLEAPARVLVRHGRINVRALRAEWLTRDELMAKLREQGVEHLEEVKLAMLEADGSVSVIRSE